MKTLNEFIELNLPKIHKKVIKTTNLLNYILKNKYITIDGLWLEFGVYKGSSIRQISKYTKKTIYGFDSFEGIPDDWYCVKKGYFSLNGIIPKIQEKNIKLIKGLFNDTLPQFVKEHVKEKIAFLHIDSDLYCSASTILTELQDLIIPGTIIIFDELINYPNYENGEFKAFYEFINKTIYNYEWIGMKGINNLCLCNPIHPNKKNCKKIKKVIGPTAGKSVGLIIKP